MATPKTYCDHSYRIYTDVLPDGRVRARARGRARRTKTFPAGTSMLEAATGLAKLIEGERFSHVLSTIELANYKADFNVYVRFK